MNRFCKSVVTFLIAVGAIMQHGSLRCVAAAPELLTTINHEEVIALWHYSGGYWGSTKYNLTIPDSRVRLTADLLAEVMDQNVEFSIPLPGVVKSAIAKGDTVTGYHNG